MSLEDHNLATVMVSYSHGQREDADSANSRHRVRATQHSATLRRDDDPREHGERGVEQDEALSTTTRIKKTTDGYTEAFHYYSKALQYTLNKATKGEPYRFVLQCNHNNLSGFETWQRLHITYDQGEKAQQLNMLSRIMKPTWNNSTQQPS
eukprot:2154822-Amphidinium_carterae.1